MKSPCPVSRTATAVATVVALALVSTPTAQGQKRVELTAFGGGALFLSDVAGSFSLLDGSSWDNQKIKHGPVFGAHGGVKVGRTAIEATLAVAPTNLASTPTGTQAEITVDQTVVIFGAHVLFDMVRTPFAELFATVGVGIKSYSADDPFGGFEAGADPYGSVGGGVRLWVHPRAAVRFDLRDYISSFDAGIDDPALQNDLLVTVGLSYTTNPF